ncbi:MAG: hypothetical protein ACP5IC_00765, partial [Minisyncoccia bacterium]
STHNYTISFVGGTVNAQCTTYSSPPPPPPPPPLPPPPPPPPKNYSYYGGCIPMSTSSINVWWTTNNDNVLQVGISEGSNLINVSEYNLQGKFVHNNLAPGSTHNYTISFDGLKTITTGQCTTFYRMADMPTTLKAFSNSPKSIYLNWKDNTTSTTGYSFQIQRIDATPDIVSQSISNSSGHIQANMTVSSRVPYFTKLIKKGSRDIEVNRSNVKDPGGNVSETLDDWSNSSGIFAAEVCGAIDVSGLYTNGRWPSGLQKDIYPCVSTQNSTVSMLNHNKLSVIGYLDNALKFITKSINSVLEALHLSNTKAASTQQWENYFTDLTTVPYSQASYNDIQVKPGGVYIYRVRIVYSNGTYGPWSNIAAAQTLPSNAVPNNNQQAYICTANSYCSAVDYYTSGSIPSEQQCSNNAGCRDVGKYTGTVQEY